MTSPLSQCPAARIAATSWPACVSNIVTSAAYRRRRQSGHTGCCINNPRRTGWLSTLQWEWLRG